MNEFAEKLLKDSGDHESLTPRKDVEKCLEEFGQPDLSPNNQKLLDQFILWTYTFCNLKKNKCPLTPAGSGNKRGKGILTKPSRGLKGLDATSRKNLTVTSLLTQPNMLRLYVQCQSADAAWRSRSYNLLQQLLAASPTLFINKVMDHNFLPNRGDETSIKTKRTTLRLILDYVEGQYRLWTSQQQQQQQQQQQGYEKWTEQSEEFGKAAVFVCNKEINLFLHYFIGSGLYHWLHSWLTLSYCFDKSFVVGERRAEIEPILKIFHFSLHLCSVTQAKKLQQICTGCFTLNFETKRVVLNEWVVSNPNDLCRIICGIDPHLLEVRTTSFVAAHANDLSCTYIRQSLQRIRSLTVAAGDAIAIGDHTRTAADVYLSEQQLSYLRQLYPVHSNSLNGEATRILVVGDGNFSFSRSLMFMWPFICNHKLTLFSTCYQPTVDVLVQKYAQHDIAQIVNDMHTCAALYNLTDVNFACDVDATNLDHFFQSLKQDTQFQRHFLSSGHNITSPNLTPSHSQSSQSSYFDFFDRIIFNFPQVEPEDGDHRWKKVNQQLVTNFLRSSWRYLNPDTGKIMISLHVNDLDCVASPHVRASSVKKMCSVSDTYWSKLKINHDQFYTWKIHKAVYSVPQLKWHSSMNFYSQWHPGYFQIRSQLHVAIIFNYSSKTKFSFNKMQIFLNQDNNFLYVVLRKQKKLLEIKHICELKKKSLYNRPMKSHLQLLLKKKFELIQQSKNQVFFNADNLNLLFLWNVIQKISAQRKNNILQKIKFRTCAVDCINTSSSKRKIMYWSTHTDKQ
ncbi:hypothetical protein RFI_21623 [Reticulomyxa filosa]|uniref:25S rRNA (uridine-N(3))-methyltransferase BMT5-like domain-containing protein n=1 Tax=Reticulomyxa filosa TaxID=46433 RepID=X6MP12_RETFI|nr:hypothetical protein RFI_21623 [Reticulomyxa filosa]|eukprot:ETO15743.1 hypothetical protein RFI_21623 [Reticulomyxa filosa]